MASPVPKFGPDPRLAGMQTAGMLPDATPGKVLVAVQHCITATFDAAKWTELGHMTGTAAIIDGHHRLLRSLHWGDDDYDDCVYQVLPGVLGESFENLAFVAKEIGLQRWLNQNDAALRAELYGGAVIHVAPLELSALTDPAIIREQLDRLQRSVEDDPALAIGTAKDLIESTCKLVLSELGKPVPDKAKLPSLIDAAQKAAAAHPAQVAPTDRGAEAARRVLGGLGSAAVGVVELRNLYGTGHGRIAATSLDSQHLARLAADTACAFCRMMLTVLSKP